MKIKFFDGIIDGCLLRAAMMSSSDIRVFTERFLRVGRFSSPVLLSFEQVDRVDTFSSSSF